MVCKKTFDESKAAVEEYATEWESLRESGKSFECYYNTNDPEDLINEKKHDKTAVIHSMLWPSLIILVCGIIFLKLETKRRGISFCGTAEFEKAKMERMAESVPLKHKCVVKAVVNLQSDETAVSNGNRRCKVKCKITHPSGQENSYISSSMSSLDRLADCVASPVETESSNGRIGVSVSADMINHHQPQIAASEHKIGEHLVPSAAATTSTNIECQSVKSSLSGAETPV